MSMVSVMLVADDRRRAALCRELERVPQTTVVGAVAEPDMLRLVRFLAPDVVVVDCGAPGVNAFIAVPWLAALPHAPQIVALGAIAYVAPDAPAALADAVALSRRLAQLTQGPIARAFHKAQARAA